MGDDAIIERGRRHVRERFRWIDGDADTWSMLRDAASLEAVVAALAELARDDRPDVVLGIESRGFALGPAVALMLGVGFAPVRKDGALLPGDVVREVADADYRGVRRGFSALRDLLLPGQRAVLVDDWIETGSQARAAAALVASCGATLAGIAVIVDELRPGMRAVLPPVRSLATADQLR
ncbi:phosphoribosyltransferase [Clavibacter lycopersici]|uniref:Phosphoribosyltransferase n=1 Tax=Clavibacter lycopersici TaxID=2301718 RepID=A0A399TAR3_9MICO|nr:phosphoribosyltransferase family protein [Clavibacter lycopersici]RIJ52319.1 phosphoribosyltransferase [Clavibacter lycopersici]RIJ58893.1 phosphoribosyltransferase [Clavibacter lycopersici]